MAIFNSNGQIIDTVNEKAQVTNPIALEFDSTASYNVGDYVSYNGSIYKCNIKIATGGDGSWIAGHWDEVKVGDEIGELKEDLSEIEPGLSDDAKAALLTCFRHVALWDDEHGQEYMDNLEAALYDTGFPKIEVSYTPGSHVVYIDDSLDTLIPYLTVTYYETEESTGIIVPSTQYSLSGTLRVGNSLVRVTYGDISKTFIVPAVDFYNQYVWSISNGLIDKIKATGSLDNAAHEIWANITNAGTNAKKRRC